MLSDDMVVHKFGIRILILAVATIWLGVVFSPSRGLEIINCDVGQGDATLIQEGNNQILIDGGPSEAVLACLGENMPFWDRKIELVVLTHPDSDHYQGLISVFRNYEVKTYLENSLETGSEGYSLLRKEVGGRGVEVVNPDEGMVIRLGKIYLDILHPDDGFVGYDTNEYSIVMLLKYNRFEAYFTGDISTRVNDLLVENDLLHDVDYIKIPHHGSKEGLTENLLKHSTPEVAVISVGVKNSYGHPHKEITDMLERYNIKILRTDEMGTIKITTDGEDNMELLPSAI